jgi:hypothetical protein
MVDTILKEIHGRRVPKDVRRDALLPERQAGF